MPFSDYMVDKLDKKDEFRMKLYSELVARLREIRKNPSLVEPVSRLEFLVPGVIVLFLLIGTLVALT